MKKWFFFAVLLIMGGAFAGTADMTDLGPLGNTSQFYLEEGGKKPLFVSILYAYRYIVEGSPFPGFCFICPLFQEFYQVLSGISTELASSLKGKLLDLLAVGVLFYLVIKIMIALIEYKKIKAAQLFSELATTLGRVIIAAILLGSLTSIVKYGLTPFLSMAIGFAQKLQETHIKSLAGEQIFMFSDATLTCPKIDCNIGDDQYLSGRVCRQIMKSICYINASAAVGVSVGITLLCYCALTSKIQDVVTGIFLGGGIAIAYLYIMFLYPFRFFDSVLRLGFIMALLPFFVVAWVFKVTRNYVKAAWMMFLNASVSLAFLILMMTWVLDLLSYGLGGLQGQHDIVQYLVAGDAEGAFQYLMGNPMHFLITFTIMYIASQLLNLNDTLVGYLTDTKGIPAMGYRQDRQVIGIGEQVFQRLEKAAEPFIRK